MVNASDPPPADQAPDTPPPADPAPGIAGELADLVKHLGELHREVAELGALRDGMVRRDPAAHRATAALLARTSQRLRWLIEDAEALCHHAVLDEWGGYRGSTSAHECRQARRAARELARKWDGCLDRLLLDLADGTWEP